MTGRQVSADRIDERLFPPCTSSVSSVRVREGEVSAPHTGSDGARFVSRSHHASPGLPSSPQYLEVMRCIR